MYTIFTTLLSEAAQGRDTVLSTIVRASGSSPRGVGAQMLAGSSGLLCGTVGGGISELRALELSEQLLRKKRGAVQEYQLYRGGSGDIGAVCGGGVTILFQYIAAGDAAWQATAREVLRRIAEHCPGTLLLGPDGAQVVSGDVPTGSGVAALPIPIGERAILFGAGHCALALSPLLQTVGFRVTVMDDRPALADSALFPGAEQVICGDFSRIGDYLDVTGEDYAVVMTSGHRFDFIVQSQLLRGPFAYVGVIGSRRKTEAVNAMLRESGVSETAIAAVHTPVGVAIKAVTPEEIAVSITGEMIYERAVRREKLGTLPHGCPMC